jgi:cell wall-associated NlpC family hydrolase
VHLNNNTVYHTERRLFIETKLVLVLLLNITLTSAFETKISIPASGYEKILSASIGKLDGQVGYGDYHIVASGPTDFAIADNGKVFILDNYNSRIVVYQNGVWERNIDYSGIISYAYAMTVHDDCIYILNLRAHQTMSYIVKISFDGAVLSKYDFYYQDNPIDIEKFIVYDDNVIALSYQLSQDETERQCFVLDDETLKVVKSKSIFQVSTNSETNTNLRFGETNYPILINDNIPYIQPCNYDQSGYIFLKYANDNGETIRQYKTNGELVGVVNSSVICKDSIYVKNNTFVTNEGDVYLSIALPNEYSIVKANIDSPETFDMNKSFINNETLDQVNVTLDNTILATDFTQPQVTATQAISTGNSMANLTWSIASANNTSSTSTITVPPTYRNVGVGTSFIGIPYCWGGMMGLTSIGSNEYMEKFTDSIASGYKAGNINTSSGYVSNSAGIDCSGFIAICYGQTVKNNTSWYLNNFGHAYANSNYSLLKPGDYLVKNGHIMLVVQLINTTQIRVLEATTQSALGIYRVVNRIISSTYYNEFTPMSAYHRPGTVWYYNPYQHYHKCYFSGCTSTVKLDAATHDFVLNIPKTLYTCTVCGYSTPVGGGISSIS